MSIKVAVLGAKGRMGSESIKAISECKDLELVAQLDLGDSLDKLASSGAKLLLISLTQIQSWEILNSLSRMELALL
jgi:dihydrodipicolinate reductase